jgi:hypothetical protein
MGELNQQKLGGFGGAKSIWDQWVLINLRVWFKQQKMAVNPQ